MTPQAFADCGRGVIAGPHRARERFVDDDDRRDFSRITPREIAARDERNAQRVEVSRADVVVIDHHHAVAPVRGGGAWPSRIIGPAEFDNVSGTVSIMLTARTPGSAARRSSSVR